MTPVSARRGRAALLALLASLAVLACSFAPPPRYYLLEPIAPEAPATPPPVGRVRVLAIDPVVLPEYLGRPEIVARTAGQELAVSDGNRWGERLQAGLDRTIALNLRDRGGVGQPVARHRCRVGGGGRCLRAGPAGQRSARGALDGPGRAPARGAGTLPERPYRTRGRSGLRGAGGRPEPHARPALSADLAASIRQASR